MQQLFHLNHHCAMLQCPYFGNHRHAVVLSPCGRGRTLILSGAPSVAPTALCHIRRQQTRRAGSHLTAARANQRDFSDLG